jgi:putative phage-type endonuclease
MSSLTHEQLLQRRTWIGASESPCLLGVSPFGNAISVWAEKMGLVLDSPTVAMAAGNYLEEGIGRWYADETRYTVAHFGSVVHPKYPFMGCTPDLCVSGERRIAQVKLVGMWMAHHWDDGVPDYVEAQVQHEMEVCDVDVCDVVALIGGTDLRIIPVERDRELGACLVEICRGFFRDHVVPRTMPAVDASTHAERTLKALFQKDNGGLITATEEIDRLARAWLVADERLGEAEKARVALTNQIKAIVGEALGIDGEFYRVRWSKTAKSRVFTVKEIALKKARAA